MVGDLYVKVALEVPTKLTAEQKKLIKQIDDGMDAEAYQKKKTFTETMREIFTGDSKVKAPSDKKKKKKKS